MSVCTLLAVLLLVLAALSAAMAAIGIDHERFIFDDFRSRRHPVDGAAR